MFGDGIKAPEFNHKPIAADEFINSTLYYFRAGL
jgi:hypothetical protein